MPNEILEVYYRVKHFSNTLKSRLEVYAQYIYVLWLSEYSAFRNMAARLSSVDFKHSLCKANLNFTS